MKKCIWCSRDENITKFNNKAHTIPKGLGGRHICENVCDECNTYFGTQDKKRPSVELVLKEAFNISRARYLHSINNIGKNKAMGRIKSVYFNVDFKNRSIDIKPAYRIRRGFQENLCFQLKRGIYKMFLEEIERQTGRGHDASFDFIRTFARYGLNDCPLIYFPRNVGIILMTDEMATSPELYFDPNQKYKYLVNEPGFYEFEFLGHVFGIANSSLWSITFDNYIYRSMAAKGQFFQTYRFVKKFDDIDLTLKILNR